MTAELTAPFVFKDEEQRIVYGPVLVPDEPDSDGDVVTAERIEKVAHSFVENYGNIDVQHSLNNVGRLVESYLLPMDLDTEDGQQVPKGSWMMGVRVTDDKAWKAVQDKELAGFSIMAMRSAATKGIGKADESKRVTLADLGDDWIVNAVSLVDYPAVPKAKWIAIKAVAGSMEDKRGKVDAALEERFGGRDKFVMVHSTLDDAVVFRIHDDMSGDRGVYQIGYTLDDSGQAELVGDAEPVLLQETIVTLDNMLDSVKAVVADDAGRERFVERIFKGIGLGGRDSSDKAGKIISSSNLEKLRKAKEAIDDLLAVGEKERSQDGAGKMEQADVKTMIDEAMAPVNEQLETIVKSLKPVEGEVLDTTGTDDSGEGATKSETVEETVDETVDETVEKDAAVDEDTDAEKSAEEDAALEKVIKGYEVPFSNRLSGQDGAVKEERPARDRDAFGFKTTTR